MELSDYKVIKKYYGEEFARFCRDKFPSILETPGALSTLLLANFNPSHELYKDLQEERLLDSFTRYIFNLTKEKENTIIVDKSAKELLSLAGYDLYECKTEEDIQSFSQYYAPGERLCTFIGNRLSTCYVFFAVKKDVDSIKRSDFIHPNRQDLYGTSVISIQFSRRKPNYLSIKNRYNHTVDNPDATFSNNLDNIIPGLTNAFSNDYRLSINSKTRDLFEIPSYVQDVTGKFYKYNCEINNVYYCPNNIIIDKGKVKKYDSSEYLLIDSYLLNLKEKKLIVHDNNWHDGFILTMNDITKIEIIKIENERKRITICNSQNEITTITIDKDNRIVEYVNNDITEVGSCFLLHSEYIERFIGNNIKSIGYDFLAENSCLKEISLDNVEQIGDDFLRYNVSLTSINFPKLKIIGTHFLSYNDGLKTVQLYNVEEVGNDFLDYSEVETIYMPLLKTIGSNFLNYNNRLRELILPSVKTIGSNFLSSNTELEGIILRDVETVGNGFLNINTKVHNVNMPSLKETGRNFLYNNKALRYLYLPSLEIAGDNFLFSNEILSKLSTPQLRETGDSFLNRNKLLKELYLPNLKSVRESFLYHNVHLKTLIAPNLAFVKDFFLFNNVDLETLNLRNIIRIGNHFLTYNRAIKELYLPNLHQYGTNFFLSNENRESFLEELEARKKVLS